MSKNNVYNQAYIYGLCCSCGLCKGICPTKSISFCIDQRGFLKPLVDSKTCINCEICVKYCPGLDIEIPIKKDHVFLYGYTRDIELRYKSSSGGVATELLSYLIINSIVDKVVVPKTENFKIIPQPVLTNDLAIVRSACTSKYIPIPTASILDKINRSDDTVAVVCLPCQAMGIRKFLKDRPQLSAKIKFIISLFCNHIPSFKATEYLLDNTSDKVNHIKQIWYRGEGWPGFIRIKTTNNFYKMPYRKTCSKGFGLFFKNLRCQICGDPFGEYGDISLGDAYFLSENDNPLGSTFCIVRNNEMKGIFESLKREKIVQFKYGPDESTFNKAYKTLVNRPKKAISIISAYEKLGKHLKINYRGKRIELNYPRACSITILTYCYRVGKIKYLWPLLPYLSILLKLTDKLLVSLRGYLKNER